MTLEESAAANGFHLGDIIDFGGATGTIYKITDDSHSSMFTYPIHVLMEDGLQLHFTIEGKFLKCQTVPVIKVIGHEKVKVKRWRWITSAGGKVTITANFYSLDEASAYVSFKEKIDFTEVEQ